MIDTTLSRIIVEIASAIVCFILVKFMAKPFQLTKEARYLGLPFGFGFLGISFVISAIVYSLRSSVFWIDLLWFQSFTRTFAFVFLAMTYYFSKKPTKNSRLLSHVIISLFVVVLVTAFLVLFIAPLIASDGGYGASQIYVRIFNLICLSYVALHTLKGHIEKPDPTTIWIPFGFILLGISEYSLLFWYTDLSLAALAGAMTLRLIGLSVFLFVSCRTFYSSEKKGEK
jgi:hypothetical protein